MRGSLVRALRKKVSVARACVEKRSHLVVVAPVLIVRVTNRASSVYDPRLDSTRVSARSDDAYVTILHFRAVIDGVDASRCALDLDASSFLEIS